MAKRQQRESECHPSLLCFQRPDGGTGWAVARDPDDYVERLRVGEYGSRAVPPGSQLTGAIRVDNLGAFSAVRDLLNQDRDLAASTLAVLTGEPAPSEEGPTASFLAEVSSGSLTWPRVSG